jgi:glycosyltransferase involved in cell wall biosynthesis
MSIARALTEYFSVNLVFRTGGRLLRDLDSSPFRSLTVIHDQPADESARLHESVAAAIALLQQQQPNYLYVNSLSASEWLLARPPSVERAALHTHEASHEMESLIIGKLFRPASMLRAEILIGASIESIGLLRSLGQHRFLAEIEFGVAIDVPYLQKRSCEDRPVARNAKGALIVEGRRLIIMCGTASPRKGGDIFAELAAELPDANFVWIGPWTGDEGATQVDWVGTKHEAMKREGHAPENLYFTGPVLNPHPWFRAADMFFLSSREDPNPMVAIEALALGKLVVSFRRSGQAGLRCMTHGVAISGPPDAKTAKPVIAALLERNLRLGLPKLDCAAFDLGVKIGEVVRALKS